MKGIFTVLFTITLSVTMRFSMAQQIAPAPLYRDPMTDGAADPVIFWNNMEKSWWMLYTQRRANLDAPDVAYCYGTPIGIATSSDHGKTWVYKGTLKLDIGKGINTFWAPEVVFHNGVYHLFVTYIEGVYIHWGGKKRLAHFTSSNLWDWEFRKFLKLSSDNVIDGTLYKMPDNVWRIWYKDENNRSAILMAESKDLENWEVKKGSSLTETEQEGPKVFRFANYYWMLTDEWKGMRVYRSADGNQWLKQGLILENASSRPEDKPSGAHGDVVIVNNTAYVFYFTHPEREAHIDAPMDANGIIPFKYRRSSIQVARLDYQEGTLVCNREQFDFWLPDN
jgi:sucrose-6-phosphate hydrolase SacC (GH32 family)